MNPYRTLFVICIVVALGAHLSWGQQLDAYYTKVDSGESFEQVSRTGSYADITIDLEDGQFVFWRGSSYLPFWQTSEGRWFADELVERSGDGPSQRPDRTNTYSRVALVESTPEKAVICWRYLPQFSGTNPHIGVDATKFVDEYFVVRANGSVTRTIRRGTEKIEDWRDPLKVTTQTFDLTANGIKNSRVQEPGASPGAGPVAGVPRKRPAVGRPVAWWTFDEGQGDTAMDLVSEDGCLIEGHKSLWKQGVSGTALQFDGYNTCIRLTGDRAPQVRDEITLEGWVAIGAYPWSWTPIVQQCDEVPEVLEAMKGQRAWLVGEEELEENDEEEGNFAFVIKKQDDVGYYLGIDGLGHPGLKIRIGDAWRELVSDVHLERRRWYHIVGTYSKDSGMLSLYVDGEPAGSMEVPKGDIVMSSKDIKIGKGKPRRPIKPVRANTFIDSYSFDGLIDEVKIHDEALSAFQVSELYASVKPDADILNKPDMDKRVLPKGRDSGRFGAYYAHLKFYETWDNLWRFSDHPDIVVEFDESPAKFVFWRGVGYIPMMVNEKGQWYSNEFNETWNRSGGQGCQEPMSDKESYTNHARIIENTPARVVVHWRYPLVDVHHVLANYNDETGWGDWADWYYYIYPDGVAAKKMHLWTDGLRDHEWQESMAILGPDQHPEQVLETAPALLLADLDGAVDEYNWVGGPPDDVSYKNKKIQVVNYRAEYDPFTVGDFVGGNVYGGELTEYAVFPTWNHWPVSQMPSDGRLASFPDRTAHSSLTHVFLPVYKEEESGDTPYYEKVMLEGMTNMTAAELVPLAKSWLHAPVLRMKSGGASQGYNPAQRAYVLAAESTEVAFSIEASDDSPVANLCLVVKNWPRGVDATVEFNGKELKSGPGFHQGSIRETADTEWKIIWIEATSQTPVELAISRAE